MKRVLGYALCIMWNKTEIDDDFDGYEKIMLNYIVKLQYI